MTDSSKQLDQFYHALGIPGACLLDKRLYKKQFYEHTQLRVADKKAFIEEIEHIKWRYTLKPATINIPSLVNKQLDYLEIAILEVTLHTSKNTPASNHRYKRIAEVIQKAIPYPCLIIFAQQHNHQQWLALSAADKVINQADTSKIRLEALYDIPWLNLSELNTWQQAFIKSLQIQQFSYLNLYAFYQELVQRFIALQCASHTGVFALSTSTPDKKEQRLTLLKEIDQLTTRRIELKNKLKKEKNLGSQVELNTLVRKLGDDIFTLSSQL